MLDQVTSTARTNLALESGVESAPYEGPYPNAISVREHPLAGQERRARHLPIVG